MTMMNPFGGATLGSNTSLTVTIIKNDDANGVFTLSSNSLVVRISTVVVTDRRSKALYSYYITLSCSIASCLCLRAMKQP